MVDRSSAKLMLQHPRWERATRFVMLASSLILFGGVGVARANEAVPIKIIGNLIVVESTLQTGTGVQTCLLIDLGSKAGLQLHKNTAEALEIKSATTPVEVLFGPPGSRGPKLTVSKLSPAADEDQLSLLTRNHAEELLEVPVGAVLGLGAFPDHVLQIDVAAGVLRFASAEADAAAPGEGTEFSYREVPTGLLLTNEGAADQPKAALSTIRYEAVASPDTLTKYKIGSSEALPLAVGGIDTSKYTAFRISKVPGKGDEKPDIVLGAQFASQFRIQINTATKRLWLIPPSKPRSIADEQAVLLALNAGNVDGLEAFLKANPESWLAPELGLEILKRRTSDRNATPEQLTAAILFYVNGVKEDGKAAALLAYADALLKLNDSNRIPAIGVTLEIAARYSAKDLNNSALHQINARRGLLEMRKGDLKAARRYLMSASFGLPRDPAINIMLGALYRRLNQPARAWSKYIDATLVKDPPDAAFKALAELNDDLAFRASFGGGDAELLLEGRAVSFSPTVSRTPEQRPAVRIVEFFSDTNAKTAVGPQLAFNGLRDFFTGTPAVFIGYHLDDQLGNPLVQDRAAAYGIKAPGVLLADGKVIGNKPGELKDAEAIYESYLPSLVQSGAAAVEPSRIQLTAHNEGRLVKTTVRYTPPKPITDTSDFRLRVLLCEQRVFVPYGPVPIQYAVARAEFTPPGGTKIAGATGPLELSVDVDRFAKNFQLDPARLERQADRIDIREAQVIAFIEDADTHQILDAIAISPATTPTATSTLEAKP